MASYLTLLEEEEEYWVPIAETYLEGTALEQWRVAGEGLVTWPEFKTFLEVRFSDVHTYQVTMQQLHSLRVSELVNTLTVAACSRKHIQLCAKAGRQGGEQHGFRYQQNTWLECLRRSGSGGNAIAADLLGCAELPGLAFDTMDAVYRYTQAKAGIAGVAAPSADVVALPGPPWQEHQHPRNNNNGGGRFLKVGNTRGAGNHLRPPAMQNGGVCKPAHNAGRGNGGRPHHLAEPSHVNGVPNLKAVEGTTKDRRYRERRCAFCGQAG